MRRYTPIILLLPCSMLSSGGCSSSSHEDQLKSAIQAEIAFVRQTLPKVSYEMPEADAREVGKEIGEHQMALPDDWKATPEMVPALRKIRGAEQLLGQALSYYGYAHKVEKDTASGAANIKSRGDECLSHVSNYADSAEQLLQTDAEKATDAAADQ